MNNSKSIVSYSKIETPKPINHTPLTPQFTKEDLVNMTNEITQRYNARNVLNYERRTNNDNT